MKESRKKLLKGIVTAAAAAGAVYGMNRLVFFLSTMKDLLTSKEKSYYNWRFGDIYYARKGEGRPVLLLHQLSASGSDCEWQSMIDELAENHTVYTIDLPGCGRSQKEKMVYTNYLYVQAVNDFVKHVIKTKTDIITSGDTSSIAVMACHSEPSLYGRFIFINPESLDHMIKTPGPQQKCLSYLLQLPLVGTLYYVLANSRWKVKRDFRTKYYYNGDRIEPGMEDMFYEAAYLGGFAARFAYASQVGYYTRINVVYALKQIDHSMYIIGGEAMEGMDDTIAGYTHFNPAIEAVRLEGTKGMPHMEKPVETADLCKLYLER